MKKAFKFLLITAIVLFIGVNAIKFFNPEIKTDMVSHGEMEMSYSLDALIIRNETVVTADRSGVLESMVTENEMVRKDKHIASIYESEVDENAKKKLIYINERINEIQNARAAATDNFSDDYRVESSISGKITEMIKASAEHDVSKMMKLKNELGLLNDKKNALSGNIEKADQILNSLKSQKAEYEGKLSRAKQDLFSPASGIYSTNVDGFEKLVTDASAKNMLPDDLETLLKTKITADDIKKSQIVCKVIDSFEWSASVIVTQNELSNIKMGDTVYLRNHNSSEDAVATVTYISTPQNGKYVLTATSDATSSWAMEERIASIDLVKKRYSGLKVPIAAIRVKDDITGVYTVVDSIVRFKKVNILYKNNKYAIVEENNTQNGGLLLYDEVITSGNKIKDGMRLNH